MYWKQHTKTASQRTQHGTLIQISIGQRDDSLKMVKKTKSLSGTIASQGSLVTRKLSGKEQRWTNHEEADKKKKARKGNIGEKNTHFRT